MRVLLLLSFLVVALACFASTSTSTVSAAGNFAYQVGTEAGKSDVVDNGIARAPWNGVGTMNVYPRDTTLRLVSRIDPSLRPQVPEQDYSISFRVEIGTAVQVYLDPKQATGTLKLGFEQNLDIKFICLSTSVQSSKVTVIVAFPRPVAEDVQFVFNKVCELPPLNIGTPGPDGVRADIVANGIPVPNFKYTSKYDEDQMGFDLWLPINSPYYPYFNITSHQLTITHDPYVMKKTVQFELSEPYILPSDVQPYTRLTLRFFCDETLPASSTEVSVMIDNGFNGGLRFAFMKNCSNGLGQSIPDVFHVGSSSTSNDVMQGGIPIGAWGTNSGFKMPINEHEIDLWIYINSTTRLGDNNLPVNVIATVSNDNKVFILNEGSDAPRQFWANMSNSPTSPPRNKVPMEITCISPGTASGTVLFVFGDIYRDVTVRFEYTCSFPYFDVNFMNADASSVIAPVIVRNVQSWNYVSPQTAHKEVFAVTLNKDAPWDVQDITFDYVGYDSSVMKPQVIPTTGWMPATQKTPIPMQIYFHCIQDLPVTTTPVTISIDYGWSEKTNITFQKTCPEIDSPASSSGWSAAGIFFFTVFILTLVGCLTGAGYKYTKEEKRGWEIIPGITYYRACYDKACPTKRYTPQTDYYQDNVPDHGGKSYQTEL